MTEMMWCYRDVDNRLWSIEDTSHYFLKNILEDIKTRRYHIMTTWLIFKIWLWSLTKWFLNELRRYESDFWDRTNCQSQKSVVILLANVIESIWSIIMMTTNYSECGSYCKMSDSMIIIFDIKNSLWKTILHIIIKYIFISFIVWTIIANIRFQNMH